MRNSIVMAALVLCLAACGSGGASPITVAFQSALESPEPGYLPDQLLANLSLGLDFDVLGRPVEILSLGVFDWQGDGLASDHTVCVFDRNGALILARTVQAGEGYLENGFRFVDLQDPIQLPAGFAGTIAVGYNAGNADRNANVHGDLQIDPPPVFAGAGLVANVGTGRYGFDPLGFPDIPDLVHGAGPPNRYHAGSFRFRRR